MHKLLAVLNFYPKNVQYLELTMGASGLQFIFIFCHSFFHLFDMAVLSTTKLKGVYYARGETCTYGVSFNQALLCQLGACDK